MRIYWFVITSIKIENRIIFIIINIIFYVYWLGNLSNTILLDNKYKKLIPTQHPNNLKIPKKKKNFK